ncbi:MAG: 3-dehydroquinate synthase [Planctomycetota bacterium]|nr:3-dehydroquinate synthase [Planctomycetota bacterium]
MAKIVVRTPGGSYPVRIGAGAIEELPRLFRGRRAPSSLFLVTDTRVRRHHGAQVERLLAASGLAVARIVLPAGEGSKSVEQLERIWRAATRHGVDRQSCFVALGGGVIGDLTGFAAASTLRGVDFVQVPTTLLAMVDASVGGKTGINLPEGKNLVGAFHQPRAVVMDLDFLATLPPREWRAGWAEVIKTAAILDAALFRQLERRREDLLSTRAAPLAEVVARCVRIKAKVVESDERESGLRRILNFGHTLAHGIEAAQGYGGLLHGEAVAVGMVFAARLGETLGQTPPGVPERLERLLEGFGLPVALRTGDASRILSAMSRDKKRGPRGLRWVLLQELGRAETVEGVRTDRVSRELRKFLRG